MFLGVVEVSIREKLQSSVAILLLESRARMRLRLGLALFAFEIELGNRLGRVELLLLLLPRTSC